MNFSQTEIAKQVLDLCRWTCARHKADIEPSMSLTQDLGFDTVKLVNFFADVEELYPGVSLERWFSEHASSGKDTLDSAVSYVLKTLSPTACTDTNKGACPSHA